MAQIFINANRSAGTINKNIYGHFAEHLGRCIYGGLANADGTPRADVIEALKGIDVPVLRWPGGCFADTYHWRDGVGPKAQRKTIVNTNWGGVTENNAFGTHEFLEVCRQLGCDPYISGNVGSGTVQEFSDWVEYCNMPGVSPMADLRRQNGGDAPFNVQYWGVGNENWGCGGNMRPEHYADLCRQYATFLRSYDNDAPLYKIACGPSNDDYRWTKVVAEQAGRYIDALSLHYYTLTLKDGDWQHKGSATEFSRCELYEALRQAMRMEEMVENHGRIMRRVCPEKKLGLVVDEWGTWFDVEPGTNPGFLYQQNTMRDALVAALTLNIFNNHCDTVVMANIAQIANVLQSMVLTEGDKLLLTPTYHVFKMYKAHQNARQLEPTPRPACWTTRPTACPTCRCPPASRPTAASWSRRRTSTTRPACPSPRAAGRRQGGCGGRRRAHRRAGRVQHLRRARDGRAARAGHHPDRRRLHRRAAPLQRRRVHRDARVKVPLTDKNGCTGFGLYSSRFCVSGAQ